MQAHTALTSDHCPHSYLHPHHYPHHYPHHHHDRHSAAFTILGQYVLVAGSSLRPGNSVMLLTPDLTTTGNKPPYMVTFWYHAYGEPGDHPYLLRVFEFDGVDQSGPIWSINATTEKGIVLVLSLGIFLLWPL